MNKSIHFVGIEGSYKSFDIALFEGTKCVDEICNIDERASSQFLVFLQNIFAKNNKKLSDLSFLAVNHGPGAFTSLRVVISTVNAIAFSGGIKLVSVDGLDALERETRLNVSDNCVIIPMLNAYNNDVYYASNAERGYKKIDALLPELARKYRDREIIFTGNGAHIHKELICEYFKNSQIVPLQRCSAKQVGFIGLEQWNRGERIVDELRPAYLKVQTYAVRR
jgi:tRNA threonylcarbamoyl adenosine modification protein YeaZ